MTTTGVSNGAGFATRLGCELPDSFAGVAPVSAGFRALDPCPATARTSLLAIHGTADTIVPYNGKKPGREGSVPRFAARWARRVGCSPRPVVTSPRPRVTRITYRGCDGGLHVGLVRLTGNTHGWAGARRSPFPQRNPSPLQRDGRGRDVRPCGAAAGLAGCGDSRVVPHTEPGHERAERGLDADALGVRPGGEPCPLDRRALFEQILDELG